MEWVRLSGKIQLTSEDGSILEAMVTDKTEDAISFSISADDKKFKLFRLGDKIEAMIFERNKGMRFEGVISGRVAAEAPTYTISQLCGWKNVQRRDNVRVPCSNPLTYTANRLIMDSVAFSRDLTRVREEILMYMRPAFMVDISAGGMKFSCEEDIKEGQVIIMEFQMNQTMMILRGIVKYRQMIVNSSRTRYFYGIQFKDITEKTKEKIVNHVFQLLRKIPKK